MVLFLLLLSLFFLHMQDDLLSQGSKQGNEQAEQTADGTMRDEEEGNGGKVQSKTTSSRQNELLYAAEGILNPKMKRAEKKRRKKGNKLRGDAMDDDDYDFKVDYNRKASGHDQEDGDIDDDGNHLNGEVPMSGVEFEE